MNGGKLRIEKKHLIYSENAEGNILCYANAFECFDREVNSESLYVSKGPVIDKKVISIEDAICAIWEYAKSLGLKYVRFNMSELTLDIKKIEIYGLKCYMIPRNEYSKLRESPREAIVDLGVVDEEQLLEGFHYKTRYNIRKSIRSNLEVLIQSDIDINQFYALYLETAKRHEFLPHDLEYFNRLIRIFKDKVVFCTIKFNDKVLAMSINIKQSNTLFYLYGVSSTEHRNVFPCYNMHWNMMKYAMKLGLDYYNFGGVFADDDQTDSKDYGLLIFKSRFCKDGFREYLPDFIIF